MNKQISYKNHTIMFHNLLTEGGNIDQHILKGTLFNRADHQFDKIVKLLKPNSVVYDIGAYIGTYSIPMALEGMEIIAFEGFPDNYDRTVLNVEPYNITIFPVALSNESKEVFTKFNDCRNVGREARNIKYVRLDDYMKEHNLKKPDLVKMDIEGMETLALHGMTNLLEKIRPIWQIGYHPGEPIPGDSKFKDYPGFVKVENGGFDFKKFNNELGYRIFDESGRPCAEFTHHGEYYCIPEEKIKKSK